ncbi:VOC family protein [Modestobacter excelsi]|uniref:VOC family protein n=1 Tax=Modestobacter excelsi TaxID=2213161 RepID=UPI001C20C70A|nr:VOC family protein [Modestobacter excelsi]
MRSRMTGMWWGTAIEAPDPGALARFYAALLEWPIGHEEPGTAILAAPEGSMYVTFQQATGYRPPVWPHRRAPGGSPTGAGLSVPGPSVGRPADQLRRLS